jgi:hypothetical protein
MNDQTETLPDSLSEHEYAVPCETLRCTCDSEASVAVWARHRNESCPGVVTYCPVHLAAYIADYADWHRHTSFCRACGSRVEGPLGEHIRVMPL